MDLDLKKLKPSAKYTDIITHVCMTNLRVIKVLYVGLGTGGYPTLQHLLHLSHQEHILMGERH